jgi:hypothetical protein
VQLQQQQQEQREEGAEEEGQDGGASAASGPSIAGPINIPQPVRRPPRAANAYVRSPSGTSFIQAAATAAAAGAGGGSGPTAAAAAAGSGEGMPAGCGSSSSSPGLDKGRGLAALEGQETAAAAAAGSSPAATVGSSLAAAAAAAAGVQRSPSKGARGRPPLPSYSRSSSAVSRSSVGSSDVAMPGSMMCCVLHNFT